MKFEKEGPLSLTVNKINAIAMELIHAMVPPMQFYIKGKVPAVRSG